MRPLAYTLTDAQGPLTPPPPDASPQQRVPTLRVLIVTVRAATMAGKLALEGYREGVAGKVHVHRPPPPAHHLPSTHLTQPIRLALGMHITEWRLPSWEHDSSGEEGVKGTAEADTPFRT